LFPFGFSIFVPSVLSLFCERIRHTIVDPLLEIVVGYCLSLERLLESVELIASVPKTLKDVLIDGFVHGRGAAQNPKIIPARMAHNSVIVFLTEIDDPIITPERPEKTHLQFGIRPAINHPSMPTSRVLWPVYGPLAASVNDVNFAVLTNNVRRCGGGASSLEALRIIGDLVPGTCVALKVYVGNRFKWR
tara:strand:- start:473 stop:1042 length:570 start_codon:yes stop_codon:yes gene_type:complete